MLFQNYNVHQTDEEKKLSYSFWKRNIKEMAN